ncbi:hypothetical protein B5J93_04880 [Moraxella equi]|uniref:Uncharacterized protein n=1 Tax=Moraxella equi TaxID=60442 RepID=A0ABX3NIL3_9GAMM|nr:hypothetical protein B5J93_04880 [Moraxella equi]
MKPRLIIHDFFKNARNFFRFYQFKSTQTSQIILKNKSMLFVRACLPFVFAMKNKKNHTFFKEKSAVDIGVSPRILTSSHKI